MQETFSFHSKKHRLKNDRRVNYLLQSAVHYRPILTAKSHRNRFKEITAKHIGQEINKITSGKIGDKVTFIYLLFLEKRNTH